MLAHTLSGQIEPPAQLSHEYITSEELAAVVYKFAIVGCKDTLGGKPLRLIMICISSKKGY